MNYTVPKTNSKKSALQFIERTNKMTNINNNIAFKELKRGKITFTIWKKYLRNILIGLFLLQAIASTGLFYGFLYQSENIISTQNIYVTKEVALNYINPIKPDTYKTQIGQFIASHKFDFEVNPNNKIPFKNYKEVIDHLTNNQLYILKENYQKYWLITLLLSLGISLYWNYSQYLKDTAVSKKALHKRGMQLLSQKQISLYTKNKPHVLSIGNINIPTDTECKHILVFGASGSGKSVLLSQFLNQINTYSQKYNDKRHYIITDVKPEFVGKFAKPDDYIFCPFDKRSISWSIFNDIDDISDYDTFASILFEQEGAKDPFWGLAAGAIFADGLKYLDLQGRKTNHDILDFFKQSTEYLTEAINSLPPTLITSKQYLNAPDNTFASILATLASGLKPFMHLKDSTDNNAAFSFKQYIREEYQRTNGTIPNLYLLVPANRQRIMAPLLSLVMDIMINEALTLPESQNCRLYFIIDEIGSVNKIQLLPDLITKGRSYGISILALTQDPGLLREKYGPQVMQSFLNNFGTQIVLRINDAATAKELADNFGVEEIIEYKESIQLPQKGSPIPSITQDTTTKSLILPSQLQSLPPFKGYGKILGFNPFNLVIPQLFFSENPDIKHFDPIDRKTINSFKPNMHPHRIKFNEYKEHRYGEDLINKYKKGE